MKADAFMLAYCSTSTSVVKVPPEPCVGSSATIRDSLSDVMRSSLSHSARSTYFGVNRESNISSNVKPCGGVFHLTATPS